MSSISLRQGHTSWLVGCSTSDHSCSVVDPRTFNCGVPGVGPRCCTPGCLPCSTGQSHSVSHHTCCNPLADNCFQGSLHKTGQQSTHLKPLGYGNTTLHPRDVQSGGGSPGTAGCYRASVGNAAPTPYRQRTAFPAEKYCTRYLRVSKGYKPGTHFLASTLLQH